MSFFSLRVVRQGVLLGALLIGSGVRPVVAQGIDPLAKADRHTRFLIGTILDSARIAQLPTARIRAKAIEGISKRVDDGEVVRTARSILVSLREARAVLGAASDANLSEAANVLAEHMKPNQLVMVRSATEGRSIVCAFSVLSDLVALGVRRENATSAIAKLWQGGASDADFYRMWSDVQSDALAGANAAVALQRRVQEFRRGTSPRVPVRRPDDRVSVMS